VVSAAELRHAMGHFATGVTVITSVGADGKPVGTTANAVSSLSLDPPLLLACFDLSSHTLAAIRAHGAFSAL
jgi:flavin reductase (DIM6/NTAB) family NADH-FMN oxidoreductase RutF